MVRKKYFPHTLVSNNQVKAYDDMIMKGDSQKVGINSLTFHRFRSCTYGSLSVRMAQFMCSLSPIYKILAGLYDKSHSLRLLSLYDTDSSMSQSKGDCQYITSD